MAESANRFLLKFVNILSEEIGPQNLLAVLEKDSLPVEWADPKSIAALDNDGAVKVYAGLQSAMRTYYGRGARGLLLQIGSKLWNPLLGDAALSVKARAGVVRRLPGNARNKATLELLAQLLSVKPGDVTVHTLDLDLLLVDHVSPSASGQSESAPICFVTQGLIREALYWATSQEFNIEETACRAMGGRDCEFKITLGGTL